MEMSLNKQDETIKATLSGSMAFDDNRVFRELYEALKEPGMRFVVLDLSKVDRIDSAGLGMFIILHQEAKQRRIGVTLQHPQEQVRKLLMISKFDTMFEIV